MKAFKITLLSAVLAFGMPSFANISVSQSTDGVLAKVNDEVILKSEFVVAAEALAQEYAESSVNATPHQIQNQALNSLITRKIQLGIVKRAGFNVNETLINRQLAQIANAQGFSNLNDFQRALDSQQAGSYASLRNQLIEDASLTALWQAQVAPRIKISDQEVTALLNSPEGSKIPHTQVLLPEWQTSHILARVDETQNDAMAQQRIQAIYANLQQGADFKALASTYSDDTGSALQSGSLGWVSEGQMVSEFENMMKSTPRGTFSQPFRSQFGWHILKVDNTRQRDVSTQQRRNLAKEILFNRMAPQAEEDWVQEIRAGAYVEILK